MSTRAVIPPQVIIFPKNEPDLRTLIIRNATEKDYVIKLVPSCVRAFTLEGKALLVQKRRYAEVFVGFDPALSLKDKSYSHFLSVYARPIESYNHPSLRFWLKGSTTTPNQLVTKMVARVEAGYSALQVVVDLPGGAMSCEPLTTAAKGVDESDARTCLPIDGDTATGVTPLEKELAALKKQMKQEKCWLLEMLFPSADVTNTTDQGINQEQNFTPCGGC
ncbi:unnamed protein product, partial [Mesorhabditis belari]|uniref:Major sperm protein n=1 Tax=Mesorhabditis belari TaxID=2138241 RepID=A0AAF3F3B8_9BILA